MLKRIKGCTIALMRGTNGQVIWDLFIGNEPILRMHSTKGAKHCIYM